jgi:hypothetical protein
LQALNTTAGRTAAFPFASIGAKFEAAITGMSDDWNSMLAARESFVDFALYVGRDKKGEPLQPHPYFYVMAALHEYCWENKRHLNHTAPFGIGKTTTGRLFAPYLLGRDPGMAQVVVSGGMSISERLVAQCRKTIVSKRYRQIFPEVVPDDNRRGDNALDKRKFSASCFFLRLPGEEQSPDPAMDAVPIIPDTAARRVDLLIVDDGMTREIAESAQRRNSVNDSVLETWILGRCSNGGVTMAYQNVWHKEDLAHVLIQDKRFISAWVGVTADRQSLRLLLWNAPDDMPFLQRPHEFDMTEVRCDNNLDINQEREFHLPLPTTNDWTPEKLREKEQAPGDGWRKVYLMNASSKTDKMLPHFNLRVRRPQTVHEMLGIKEMGGLPYFDERDQHRFVFGLGFDISAGKRKGDALWALAMDAQRRIYPVEFHLGSWSTSEAAEIVDGMWKRGIRFGCFYVEDNAVQKKIREEIAIICRQERRKYDWWSRVLGFMTGTNKIDSMLGLPALDVEIETGAIIWPGKESGRPLPHATDWLQCETEMANVLKDTKKEDTPDGLMAFWFARRALDRCSMPGKVAEFKSISINVDRSVRKAY